jgi:hypothetical protein
VNKCPRNDCGLVASHRVRVTFLSGRRLDECLCESHANALHVGLLAAPQTLSGSCTPLPLAVAA